MADMMQENARLLAGWRPDHEDRKIMFAGRYDPATGLADPNVYNGLAEGFIWVRDRDSRVAVPALMSLITAMSAPRFGDRLRTGINEEGDREAIAPYIIRENVNKLFQMLYESKKATPTPLEAMEGGIVRAPDDGSLKLYVGVNEALGWAGGLIDVDSGDVPTNANEFAFLVVYFTGEYGAPPTYEPTTPHVSATVDSFKATYLTDAYTVELPNGAYRQWGVTVGYGQTGINYTESRFVHLRNIYNPDWLVTVDVSAASDGDVATWDAAGNEWVAAAPGSGSGGGALGDYILIRDEKSAGTGGGTFTAGAWRTRTLNTEVVDTGNHASLSSNQITLDAGTYRFHISCPAQRVGRHQARLYNISDSTEVERGTSNYAYDQASGSVQNTSEIIGRMTIAATKTFEVQHQGAVTSNTFGFGVDANLGGTEVYAVAQFWKE